MWESEGSRNLWQWALTMFLRHHQAHCLTLASHNGAMPGLMNPLTSIFQYEKYRDNWYYWHKKYRIFTLSRKMMDRICKVARNDFFRRVRRMLMACSSWVSQGSSFTMVSTSTGTFTNGPLIPYWAPLCIKGRSCTNGILREMNRSLTWLSFGSPSGIGGNAYPLPRQQQTHSVSRRGYWDHVGAIGRFHVFFPSLCICLTCYDLCRDVPRSLRVHDENCAST